MSLTSELYMLRASQDEQEAATAALDNVRERALRSAAAWRGMADRLIRTETMRNAKA